MSMANVHEKNLNSAFLNSELNNVFLLNEVVQYRIHRQRRDGLDAGFADDVLAVGDDGVDGDVELIGYFIVFQSLREADEHVLLAVGERGGVGLVVVGLERAGHLVKGRFDALDVVVELDDTGELPLVLGFEVGGDEPDDTQVRQLVELGAKRGTFGVIEQQRIDYQDIRTQGVDSGIQGAQIIR